MALDRVDFPTTPNPVSGDWALVVDLVSKAYQNTNSPLQIDGSNIPQGAVFQIGGVIYYGSSDTAITGTPSDYVQLTPNVGDSGATCDAAFISSLSGVTWNKIYNGYYDSGGDDLIIFHEMKALIAGDLSVIKTKFSEMFDEVIDQNLKTTDNVEFVNLLLDELRNEKTGQAETLVTGSTAINEEPQATQLNVSIYTETVAFYAPGDGTINFRFSMRTSSSGHTGYGRIYVNGSPVGTVRSTNSTSKVYYAEDISISLGDRISIYGYSVAGGLSVYYHDVEMRVGNTWNMQFSLQYKCLEIVPLVPFS